MINPRFIQTTFSEQLDTKPLEIYFFINPFCGECWALTPIIMKLQIEYGDYFTLKYVLCGTIDILNDKNRLDHLNNRRAISDDLNQSSEYEGQSVNPHIPAIGIKAAELQGKKAGMRFIRRLQELMFIENADITDMNILKLCALDSGLDIDEFMRDIYSVSASRAFQCDLSISSEMEVTEMPAMVFFNENIEDEGLKITGLYSYSIYVQIMNEMVDAHLIPAEIPPLETFLSENPIIASQDLAMIYDQPIQQIERQMKKLQLQQKVQKLSTKNGSYWKYHTFKND